MIFLNSQHSYNIYVIISQRSQLVKFLTQAFLFGYHIAVPQPVPSSKGRSKKVLESVFRIPPELDMSLLLEFIG